MWDLGTIKKTFFMSQQFFMAATVWHLLHTLAEELLWSASGLSHHWMN